MCVLCRRLESVAMASVCWSWSSPSFPRSGVRVGEVVEVVWWLSLAGEAVVPVKWCLFVPGFLPRSVGAGSGADGGFSGGGKERGGSGSDADWGAPALPPARCGAMPPPMLLLRRQSSAGRGGRHMRRFNEDCPLQH